LFVVLFLLKETVACNYADLLIGIGASHSHHGIARGNCIAKGISVGVYIVGGNAVCLVVAMDPAALEFNPVKI